MATEKYTLESALAKIAELEQKLADKEANLRLFVRQSPNAVAMFDKQMNYLATSDKYNADYGQENESLIGLNHYELFPDVPERWKAVHKRCMKGVEESCEEDTYVRKDGQVMFLDWVVKPWYNEHQEVGGLLLSTTLVNERVYGKKKLLKLNQALKKSNRKLSDFALAVSHLLKEPVESVIQTTHQLRTSLQQTAPAVKKESEYIQSQVQRIQKMIEGLLLYSTVGNTVEEETVSVEKVIQQIKENLKPQLEKRGEIVVGALPQIYGNEFELLALFQNLIANGIKYNTSEDLRILITAERKGDFWEFSVSDNGMGISSEKQKDIFELTRALDLSEEYEGTGIGLPMCKRIVESMNGKIWMESDKQKGTTVMFTLPVIEEDY